MDSAMYEKVNPREIIMGHGLYSIDSGSCNGCNSILTGPFLPGDWKLTVAVGGLPRDK